MVPLNEKKKKEWKNLLKTHTQAYINISFIIFPFASLKSISLCFYRSLGFRFFFGGEIFLWVSYVYIFYIFFFFSFRYFFPGDVFYSFISLLQCMYNVWYFITNLPTLSLSLASSIPLPNKE